jgi:hypothetical protein
VERMGREQGIYAPRRLAQPSPDLLLHRLFRHNQGGLIMTTSHLRLVAVEGRQIAPVPKRLVRARAIRQEREIMLTLMREQLHFLAHSVSRMQTLTSDLEGSLGIALPNFTDLPCGQPGASA